MFHVTGTIRRMQALERLAIEGTPTSFICLESSLSRLPSREFLKVIKSELEPDPSEGPSLLQRVLGTKANVVCLSLSLKTHL